MNSDQVIVFIIILMALILFVWGRWRYDLVAMMILLTAVVSGAVPWDRAFSGFAHPAVVTVAMVLIISRSLLKSDMIDIIYRWVSQTGKTPTRRASSLAGLVAILSGLMNNVGALALLMPVGILMARRGGNPPSLYLMTMAFGSLLGGLTTLIGTPPNIIISAFREENLGEPFRMFDFAPVGVVVALAGLVFISLIGWRLIPIREGELSREEKFKVENYYTEVRVPAGSMMAGKSLSNLTSVAGSNVPILGLISGPLCLPNPTGEEILRPDDILVINSNVDYLNDLMSATKLELVGAKEIAGKSSEKMGLMEAVVMNDSILVGKTAESIYMRQHYGINLIAVAGHDFKDLKRLSQISFRPGDVLLLQSSSDALPGIMELLGCLPLAERGLKLGHTQNLFLPLAIFIFAIIGTAVGMLPVEIAFAGAATAIVLSGVLTLQEAYESVDWSIIILLGAMIPVSQSLERSGGAELFAQALLQYTDQFPAVVVLTVLLVGTMILTNIVNNAAAAVLVAPIAFNTALVMGASPDPFLMATAIGASCAFLTPIGHQSNTLVMRPGGYRFGDYWHMGLPLSVIITLVAVPLIMWFWPLFSPSSP